MYKTNESGRSMVEMLGVLAIIGVLSVAGIAGYTTASAKNRANQILNGASVRAIVVSTQIQRGANTPTLGEFTDNEVGGAKFGTEVKNAAGTATWATTDKRFSLTLENVPAEVCTQMKAMIGENGIIRDISQNCTTITYNNDLTATTFITDNKDSTSCESAGGAWNASTKTCGCPGRYTGSNCEIAPTSCPSGATTTEDGKCQRCPTSGACVDCKMEEEGICFYATCTCYNPKTQNIECSYNDCQACNKNSATPHGICSDEANCYCYNKSTQNKACGQGTCAICDKDSPTPIAQCDGDNDTCSCVAE